MHKKSKKYGTYFGKLVNYKKVNEDFKYNYNWNDSQSEKFLKELEECGVTEIVFDIDDYNDDSNTMFFETNENTDFKKLLVLIATSLPDEFSEITEHHFRMWFD